MKEWKLVLMLVSVCQTVYLYLRIDVEVLFECRYQTSCKMCLLVVSSNY